MKKQINLKDIKGDFLRSIFLDIYSHIPVKKEDKKTGDSLDLDSIIKELEKRG